MASSSSYLTNLRIRHTGINNSGKLRNEILEKPQRIVHNKFHENPSSHSRVTECVPPDITGGEVRLSLFWDAHAQRIMGNGVIVPPPDFKQRSH
jgi:hypothetical protein